MSKITMDATQIEDRGTGVGENYSVVMGVEIKGCYLGNIICCLSRFIGEVAKAIDTPKEELLETIISADRLLNMYYEEKAAQSAVTDERQNQDTQQQNNI